MIRCHPKQAQDEKLHLESEDSSEHSYPTNRQRSEELEAKVVSQPDEKFRNKKQVLFGGTLFFDSKIPLRTTLNGVSFIILSYAFYLHEARALLRRISRTGFLMTYNELMLSAFKKKIIELPLYQNETLVCKSIFIDHGFRITNPNLKEIKKDHYGCSTLVCPQNMEKLDKFLKLQALAVPLPYCPQYTSLEEA
jgi:hypothetical protein